VHIVTLGEQRLLVIAEICDAVGVPKSVRDATIMIPFSEAQASVLRALTTGRRLTWISPPTRRWLLERELITFESLTRGKLVDLRATELGSQLLALHDKYKMHEPKSKPRKDANW
jgi:hypothetical protein